MIATGYYVIWEIKAYLAGMRGVPETAYREAREADWYTLELLRSYYLGLDMRSKVEHFKWIVQGYGD